MLRETLQVIATLLQTSGSTWYRLFRDARVDGKKEYYIPLPELAELLNFFPEDTEERKMPAVYISTIHYRRD